MALLPNGGEEEVEEEELFFPRPRLETCLLWLLLLVVAVAVVVQPEVRSITPEGEVIEVEPTPVLVPDLSIVVAGPQVREKPLPLRPDATAPLVVLDDERIQDEVTELIEGSPPISEAGG